MRPPNDKAWPPVDPIEGLRIRLWRICLNDADAIARLMTPDVSQWLASWPASPTVEAMTERIGHAQNAIQEKRELHFRIEEREESNSQLAKSDLLDWQARDNAEPPCDIHPNTVEGCGQKTLDPPQFGLYRNRSCGS